MILASECQLVQQCHRVTRQLLHKVVSLGELLLHQCAMNRDGSVNKLIDLQKR